MDDSIEDRVYALVAGERSIEREKLTPNSTLSHDLGMDGDDAAEFFEKFAKDFSIDLRQLGEERHAYFSPEGAGLFSILCVLVPSGVLTAALHFTFSNLPIWLCGIVGFGCWIGVIVYWRKMRPNQYPQISVQDLIAAQGPVFGLKSCQQASRLSWRSTGATAESAIGSLHKFSRGVEETMSDRSAVMALIGAGPVGLGMAKALLEHKIPYEQLEADRELGGNWLHGVYETVHIISSRKTTEYADYPMPEDYPDFPSRQQMLDYLRDYAAKFQLVPHIQFNTKVVMVLPLADGRWELELASGEKRIYKGLIVCNGHHWDRRFPNYPGKFDGDFLHSKDYRTPAQLAGKRVLVIGGGNSACDIAAEAARVGRTARISLRRGYWFLPKTLFGMPSAELIKPWFPVWAQRIFLRVVLRVAIGKYSAYGLPEPDQKIFEAHPTINSELLYYMKQGRIEARKDVARFASKTVHFVDGTSEEFDAVVCATGYHVSFPFLPPGLVKVKGSTAQVYGGCVLAEYKNLYIIGTSQLRYGFGPVVTPGMDLMARMMLAQEQMELPIGLVMKESGVKIPRTHLVDPHAAIRAIRRGKRMLPLLLWKEKRLRKTLAGRATPSPVHESAVPQINRGLEVF